ncbi:MAG: calcineurin-like phosphoesterase family protein [Dysgonamonadaceae bacterium]|jgi:hypothetical protein|nr:calcineurin-like phosphoesterase family protein [Dysgonamonadaceae bacterium]
MMNPLQYLITSILCLAVMMTAKAQDAVSGHVRTNTGAPIAGVVVSDGFSVVKTDAAGAYSFPRNDSTEFVFISVPAAYELPVDADNLPLFYGRVPATSPDFTFDFTLTPFADGGAADLNHVLIAFGDPQVYNDYETHLFGKESVEDMKTLAASYPQGTRFYGAAVGDLVWDVYTLMPGHTANLQKLGFPVFNVIGNHDHDRNIRQDWGADHYFKENYGPTYYSVNRGKIHYIALDNIEYLNATGDKSYRHNIADYQMRWLEKDLAEVPQDMYVVFLVHAPLEGSAVANRATLYNLVASRRNTHAISGHHHRLTNYEIKANFYDHTLPAVGGLWNGYLQADGTPPGYAVFQAGNGGFSSWYYKSTGFDRNYQMRIYPVNSFVNGESMTNKIVANIWNYDSKWSDVSICENGVKHLMYQYTGIDPLANDFLLEEGDTRPNYGGTDVGQPSTHNLGASSTGHLFYYEPSDPDADFEVEVTDRNGTVYREPVLKNLMTAAFTKDSDNRFHYRQDFDDYRPYPNQTVGSGTSRYGKCTYVQGHSPAGWYACTSGSLLPSGDNTAWSRFNYIRIDNGSCTEAALYAYGNGNPNVPTANEQDRAVGTLAGTLARNIHFGLLLENNTGTSLDGIELNYTGEMWRGGPNPQQPQRLAFSYAVNPDVIALRKRTLSIAQVETTAVDSLSFVSPASTDAEQNASCNGNALRNRVPVSGRIAVTLRPGDVLLLRWEDTDDAGNDHALAIDNLEVTAIRPSGSGIGKVAVNRRSFHNIDTVVYFDEAPMSTVTLYDSLGSLVREIEVLEKKVDMAPFVSQGIYFLKTKFGTQKLIFR